MTTIDFALYLSTEEDNRIWDMIDDRLFSDETIDDRIFSNWED